MKEGIRKIIFCISLIIFLAAGYKLYTIVRDYKQNADYYNNLRQYAPKLVQVDGEDTYKFMNDDYETLYNMNSEFKAWIIVPGTNVNYPVMKGEDNDYYLKNSLNMAPINGGSIFFAYDIPNQLDALNTVIHGHHMKNGSMFGTLKKYNKQNFFNNNPYIYVVTKDKTYKYQIFSVYTDLVSTDPYQYGFTSPSEFVQYLNNLQDKSLFQREMDPFTDKDKIVTLSTCSYDFNDARMLIHGRLVKVD